VDLLHIVAETVLEAMALTAGKEKQSLTLAVFALATNTDGVMRNLVQHAASASDDASFKRVEYAAPAATASMTRRLGALTTRRWASSCLRRRAGDAEA
jgi:hypothetical protein